MLYTSGNVGEALSWLNELDRQYNLTTDEYGMGDFLRDLQEKGYINNDQNTEAVFNPTRKMEISLRQKSLDDIFGDLKRAKSGHHKTVLLVVATSILQRSNLMNLAIHWSKWPLPIHSAMLISTTESTISN